MTIRKEEGGAQLNLTQSMRGCRKMMNKILYNIPSYQLPWAYLLYAHRLGDDVIYKEKCFFL